MRRDQRIAVDLSPTKEHEVKSESGREVDAAQLRVEQLEERIAPVSCSSGGHFPEAK
jgi:hypothetical protein